VTKKRKGANEDLEIEEKDSDRYLTSVCCISYEGHLINYAQGGKTAEWMMQSQRKLCQLQLKT
jgi:hypothetical protein